MQIEKLNLGWRTSLTPIGDVKKIVIHHPAHKTWNAHDIHNYHKNTNGWNGAGYNYFITKNGQVQELRGKNIGAHAKGHNSSTLGVCFQGHFDLEHMDQKQIDAGAWLISGLIREYGLSINDIIGHRDLAATSCPGANFPMSKVKERTLEYINPNVKKESNDVKGHWAEKSIQKALDKKVLAGFPDGTFKPNEPLTRAQFAYILDKLGLLD